MVAKDQLALLKRAIAERRYDEAIQGARRLVLQSDKHPEARLLLGQALLAAGRLDEARVEMLAFTRTHPEDAEGHRLLGEGYLRDGHVEAARIALRRSLEIDPGDERTRELLAEADVDVAPISATVERWFAEGEPPTMQTTMPEYAIRPEEPQANSLRSLLQHATARKVGVELDPSYQAELTSSEGGKTLDTSDSMPLSTAELGTHHELELESREEPASDELELSDALELGTSNEIEIDPDSTRLVGRGRPLKGAVSSAAHSADATTRNPAMSASALIESTVTARHKALPDATSRNSAMERFPLAAPPELRARPSVPSPPKSTLLGVAHQPGAIPTMAAKPLVPRPSSSPSRPPTGAFATQTAKGSPSPSARPPAPPSGAFASSAGGLIAPPSAPPPRPRPSVPPPSMRPPTGAFAHAAPPPASIRPASMRPPTGAFAQANPSIPSGFAAPAPFPAFTPSTPSIAPAAAQAPFAATAVVRHPEAPAERHAFPAKAPPPSVASSAVAPAQASKPMLGSGVGVNQNVLDARAPAASPITVTAPRPAPREPVNEALKSTWTSKSTPPRPKRLVRLGIGVGVGLALLISVVLIARHLIVSSRRDEAIAVATDTGAAEDLSAALTATSDDAEPGMRALLLAISTIDQGEDRAVLAQSLAETSPSAEARIATSLTSIARGEAENALTLLEAGLMGNPIVLGEAFRARALALDSLGRHREAQMQAREAATQRPGSPRHTCLVAHEAYLSDDPTMATNVLAGVNIPDIHACVHMIRGLVALSRGDAALAEQSAAASLALPGTASDRGWAHYVRGRAALLRNDETAARAALTQAADAAPRSDETLLLQTLRALLQARDVESAHRLSARLTQAAPNLARRMEVTVDIALERRDFAAAEAALPSLAAGPRTELVRARVLESQGRNDEALTHYTLAANDTAIGADASLRQGRLLGRLGRMIESRTALETAARLAPGDAEIGSALARVAIQQGDPSTARSALEMASRAHPDDPRLLAVMALLQATEGEGASALTQAQAAAQRASTDAEIQLDIAQIARRIGNREAEAAACAEALRLDPARFLSVLCLVRTESESANFARAHELLDQASQRGAPAPDVARARAEVLVLQSQGAAGATQVRHFLETQRDDIALLSALARLQLQAEDTEDADNTARRILALDRGHPEALYVRAYAANVSGRFGSAIEYLDRISREGAARGITLQLSARVTALRGMVAFQESRYGNPAALADQALRADPRCGTAHLLRALRATQPAERRTELQAAVTGTETPAEAFGTLALLEGRGGNGCTLARQYLATAPSGYDHRAVEELASDCR